MELRIWIHGAFPDALMILNQALDPGPLDEVVLSGPASTAATLFRMGKVHASTFI